MKKHISADEITKCLVDENEFFDKYSTHYNWSINICKSFAVSMKDFIESIKTKQVVCLPEEAEYLNKKLTGINNDAIDMMACLSAINNDVRDLVKLKIQENENFIKLLESKKGN